MRYLSLVTLVLWLLQNFGNNYFVFHTRRIVVPLLMIESKRRLIFSSSILLPVIFLRLKYLNLAFCRSKWMSDVDGRIQYCCFYCQISVLARSWTFWNLPLELSHMLMDVICKILVLQSLPNRTIQGSFESCSLCYIRRNWAVTDVQGWNKARFVRRFSESIKAELVFKISSLLNHLKAELELKHEGRPRVSSALNQYKKNLTIKTWLST